MGYGFLAQQGECSIEDSDTPRSAVVVQTVSIRIDDRIGLPLKLDDSHKARGREGVISHK